MLSGTQSRLRVLSILRNWRVRGTPLRDQFEPALQGLSQKDNALAREISLGIVRNLSLLDYNIDLYTKNNPSANLRDILRIGMYQLFFLDTIPPHAAVNTSVEMAKKISSKASGGFVNAIMHKAIKKGLQKPADEPPYSIAIEFSHPQWLVEQWTQLMGPEGALNACRYGNHRGDDWIRLNPGFWMKNQKEPWEQILENAREALSKEGLICQSFPELPLHLQLNSPIQKALQHDLFHSGAFSVQDPSSYFVCALLQWDGIKPVLDINAAPGGKSACLEEIRLQSHPDSAGGPLISADLSFTRLKKIQDLKIRLKHGNLNPVVSDALHPALNTKFDYILVDAPCSNLGVLARRPEARWMITPSQIQDQATKQINILKSAAKLAQKGTRLVYSVCSSEPEEGIEVIQKFLVTHSQWQIDPAQNHLPGKYVKKDFFWMFPGESWMDGFFSCCLTLK